MNFVDTVNLGSGWRHEWSTTCLQLSVWGEILTLLPGQSQAVRRQAEGTITTEHACVLVHSVSRQISAVYWEADQPPPPTTWVHLHATHFQNLAFSLFLQNNMSAFSALEDIYVQCSLLSIQQTQIFLAYFPWEWGSMHKYWREAQLVILSVTWESSVIYVRTFIII